MMGMTRSDTSLTTDFLYHQKIEFHLRILRVKKPAHVATGRLWRPRVWLSHPYFQPWNCITKGTISKATMLMILIKGLMAGPAVSL